VEGGGLGRAGGRLPQATRSTRVTKQLAKQLAPSRCSVRLTPPLDVRMSSKRTLAGQPDSTNMRGQSCLMLSVVLALIFERRSDSARGVAGKSGGGAMRWTYVLAGGLAILLTPSASFAASAIVAHTAVCPANYNHYNPASLPTLDVTPCTNVTDFSGSIVTQTSTLQSRVDYASIGQYLDYSQAIDGTNGNGISITPSAGVWADNSATRSDNLLISGGSGAGILRIGYDLHGLVDVSNFGAGSFYNILIAMTSSAHSATEDFTANYLFQDQAVSGLYKYTGYLDATFLYNTTFNVSQYFDLRLIRPGSFGAPAGGQAGPLSAHADFLHSVDFTYSILDANLTPVFGSTITGEDGHVYAQLDAASVPEPATWALMMSGICLAGMALRSRQRSLAKP
jgi:hypothetical protein